MNTNGKDSISENSCKFVAESAFLPRRSRHNNSSFSILNSSFFISPSSIVNRQLQQRRFHNSQFKTQNLKLFDRGFTLVELLIVVSILGILAAIVLPEFSGHVQQAKEAAAKSDLRLLRETIERYAANHNGIPPGLYSGSNTQKVAFKLQLTRATNTKGDWEWPGTAGYPYGPYLSEIPKNPFTGYNDVYIVGEGTSFPTQPLSPDLPPFAWIYQPSTKTIKLNREGTDSESVPYFDY